VDGLIKRLSVEDEGRLRAIEKYYADNKKILWYWGKGKTSVLEAKIRGSRSKRKLGEMFIHSILY